MFLTKSQVFNCEILHCWTYHGVQLNEQKPPKESKYKAQERFWRCTAKNFLRAGKIKLPKAFLPSLRTLPNCRFYCTAGFGHSFDTGAQQEIEWKMQANFSAHRRRPSSLTNNDKEGSLLSFFCNNAFGIKLAS